MPHDVPLVGRSVGQLVANPFDGEAIAIKQSFGGEGHRLDPFLAGLRTGGTRRVFATRSVATKMRMVSWAYYQMGCREGNR